MFDTKKFISEIQQHTSIWDNRVTQYSNKELKMKEWDEIVDNYCGNEASEQERKKICETLQRKWRNIRDNFVKESRKMNQKPESGSKGKLYSFYNDLLFLEDTIPKRRNAPRLRRKREYQETNSDSDSSVQLPLRQSKIKKAKKRDKTPIPMVRLEKRKLEEDEDCLFFLSLVKDFKKIPEHMHLQTKLELIKVIKDAQDYSFRTESD